MAGRRMLLTFLLAAQEIGAGTLPFGDVLPRSLTSGSDCSVGVVLKMDEMYVDAFNSAVEKLAREFQVRRRA